LYNIEAISTPKIKVLKMSANTWGRDTMDPKTWDADFRQSIEFILNEAQSRGLVLQMHTGAGGADSIKLDQFMKQ